MRHQNQNLDALPGETAADRPPLSRRQMLISLGAGALGAGTGMGLRGAEADPVRPKKIAAVVTVYRHNSHADVIVGKVLEGWKHDGGPGPALELAGLYVDQFPDNDLARSLAAKHDVPLAEHIPEALTLGTGRIAVDGVLSIGEHGDYPYNPKGQHLYPRRRFFEQITSTLAEHETAVPVFNDKHLGPVWKDAKWMFARARELQIPLMAGSSLPVSFRRPDVEVPMGAQLEEIVGVGYGGVESYGFHALEFLQTFAERRRGAENGVEWVQLVEAADMWELLRRGEISRDLLEAAVEVTPTAGNKTMESVSGRNVALFRFGYRDGLQAAVFILNGFARGISVACRLAGRAEPLAAHAEERRKPRYPHFAYLLKGIERMVHTGAPAYPPERTLLTGGLLDRLLTSRARDNRRLQTPELAIAYQPVDYPYAPHIDLTADPRVGAGR